MDVAGATRTRILLVDDHPVVVQGAARLLATTPDFEVVGTASTGREALELARSLRPDVVLLDLRLGDALAPELCRKLRASLPEVRIAILTAFDDSALLHAALREGAAGLLLKDVHEFDLIRALREIRNGRRFIDHRMQVLTEDARPVGDDGNLTRREHEVLVLLARGMSSKQIADELQLAHNTVRSYSQSVLAKLDAHSRIEAVAKARQLRLV